MVSEVPAAGPISNTAGVLAALLRYYSELTRQICYTYQWTDKIQIFGIYISFFFCEPVTVQFLLHFTERISDSHGAIMDPNERGTQGPYSSQSFTFIWL